MIKLTEKLYSRGMGGMLEKIGDNTEYSFSGGIEKLKRYLIAEGHTLRIDEAEFKTLHIETEINSVSVLKIVELRSVQIWYIQKGRK